MPALERTISDSIAETISATGSSGRGEARSFTEFEELLWNAHVAKNQLLGVNDLVVYGQRLAASAQGRQLRNEGDGQSSVDRLAMMAEQVAKSQQQLEEYTVELRIARLNYAHAVLQQPSDLVDRFKAAWVADLDGPLLESFARNADPTELMSPSLRASGLAESVQATAAAARELAGEALMRKSRLFHTGLHWWLRGRY